MKRIINGVTYNTDTSAVVARYEYQDDHTRDVEATVYQTRGGAFFIVHSWDQDGDQKHYFEGTTRQNLDRLVTEQDGLEIVDEGILQSPPEAAAETKPGATIFVRVPAALKQRLDEEARAEGQSTNTYALRCFERCLGAEEVVTDIARAWYSLTALTRTPEQFNKKGCLAIANDAEEALDNALRRLGVSSGQLADFGVSQPDTVFINWGGREHRDLHEDSWYGSPASPSSR